MRDERSTHIHNLQANKKQPTSFKAPSSFVKWLILDNVSLTHIIHKVHTTQAFHILR